MAIQPINSLNRELIHEVHSFLDDRSLLKASRVSKAWRDVETLEPLRADARIRLIETPYPEYLRNILRQSGRPIPQLPLLRLPDNKGNKYIDYIQFNSATHPVMRYVDRYGRLALVFKIQGKGEGTIRIAGQISEVNFEIKQIKNTMVLFQRTLGKDSKWEIAWGNSNQLIKMVYSDRHNRNGHVGNRLEACRTCPFRGEMIADATLTALLTGRDPLFTLAEHQELEAKRE